MTPSHPFGPEPGRPLPAQAPATPGGDDLTGWMDAVLLQRRLVLLSGELDERRAGEVVTQLMTLDATGDTHVTMQVNSWGTSLEAAFAVIDTIDLLGVPVHSLCVGRAEGPVVGVVAVASKRRGAPHARFRLCAPRFETHGTALELADWSLHCQRQLDHFCDRLAQATGRSSAAVADDLEAGRFLSATEALRYGLIDEIGHVGRVAGDPPARPLGFQPPNH